MNKINFNRVWPVLIAIAVFLVVTVFFFKPVFFDNKVITQPDIQQWEGSAKALIDYREKTGEQALWAPNMFSGMPAYLISVQWSTLAIGYTKRVMSFFTPSAVCNVFLCIICYYILLLSFRIRSALAIAGAIAFGLSSYMIIGIIAGHNARIGSIAFMPLVVAGIHLAFSGKKILGFGLTTAALALHLRENHVQITYYLILIVLGYGLMQLIGAIREKKLVDFGKTIAVLLVGALIASGTYFGQFKALNEYSAYSTRGKSELRSPGQTVAPKAGLSRDQAFYYSYGVMEPMTLMVPNFYGGSSMEFLVQNPESATYKALMRSGNQQVFNQLANATTPYWGPQAVTSPYYSGAIVVFLFAVGIAFAEKKYVWWLVIVAVIGIMLSWGKSFSSFNYFLFDYLPGYSKFRSVTFGLVMTLFSLPLLGMLGLEKVMEQGISPQTRKKLWIALASTGGLCLLLILISGMLPYMKDAEAQLPAWFTEALEADRKSLLRSDAFRSLAFILVAFVVIYFDVWKKISPIAFYAFLIVMMTIDIAVVDKRYLTNESYQRKRDNTFFAPTAADKEILKDQSYYRVYNLQWEEARTSYFHNSVGGYHAAKIRRYQELADSCIFKETNELIGDLRAGKATMESYGILNMLNVKYIVYGPDANNVIPNSSANGAAWFVKNIAEVKSPTEELSRVATVDTKETAVVDGSKFTVSQPAYDSTASIRVVGRKPDQIKYESSSASRGLAVFSEIYYPEGWTATIDGQPADIKRADYVLRALEVPEGKHNIEFNFRPSSFYAGDKITMASSWLVLLILFGSMGWSVFREE